MEWKELKRKIMDFFYEKEDVKIIEIKLECKEKSGNKFLKLEKS